jgi:predicted Fe-S protein YdhL (DUF1289 family)
MRALSMASDTLHSMEWNLNPTPSATSTPCIGICTLDQNGLCEGCLRSSQEIGAWSQLSEAERRRIMDQVLPLRVRDRGRR